MSNEKQVKFITETEVINKYLVDIRKYGVLSADEEKEMFRRYVNGDMQAREAIILANQRFIYSQAKIYARNEEDIMDYVSEGNIGIMEAIDAFDYTKGYKFITFAVWYIRRAMNSYMNNQRDCIVKSNNTKYGNKVDKIKNKFFSMNGRYPYPNEIADILFEEYNIEVVNLSDLYELEITSINDCDDSDTTIEEVSEFAMKTAENNEFDSEVDKSNDDESIIMVDSLLDLLSSKRQVFMKKLFGIGTESKTVGDMCREYNISEAVFNKIKTESIRYMKQEYDKNPEEFMVKIANIAE